MYWLVRHRGAGKPANRRHFGRLWSLLPALLCFALVWAVAAPARAFDLPKYDPWYYHSDEQGYRFAVPDKVQHFYGSVIVNEFSKQLPLPGIEVLGPILSLTAGFMWETYQDQKGVGFSERDLAADALGVVASQFSSERLSFWLDYSTTEQVIMFKLAVSLGH